MAGNYFDQFDSTPASGGGNFFDQFDEKPAPERKGGFGAALVEGAQSTGRSLKAAGQALASDLPGVEKTARDQGQAQQDSQAAALFAFKQALANRKQADDDSIMAGVKNYLGAAADNPAGALQMLAEQLPNAAVVLGGGAAGAKAGAMAAPFLGPLAPLAPIAGGVLGLFAGNASLETGGKAIEKGADGFTPTERDAALKEGAVKGAVVTGVDALTLGASKMLFSPVGKAMEQAGVDVLSRAGVNVSDRAAVETALKTPDLAREVRVAQAAAYKVANAGGKGAARVGGAIGLETLGEGVGEGLGEYAATGTYSPTDAVTEAFAGLGQSAAEVAIGKSLGEAKNRLPGSTVAPSPVAPDPLDATNLTYEKAVDTYLRGPTEAQTGAAVIGAGSIDEAIAAAEAAVGDIPSIAGDKGIALPRAGAPANDSLSVIADPALAARQAGAVEAARAQLDGTFPRPVIDPATQASEDLEQNKIVERELMLDDAVRKVEQRAAGAQQTVAADEVQQRLQAAQAQGDQQAMLRAAQIRDRGQVVASQMTEELSRGDKQRFRIAYENVAKRGGVATPGEAAVLDRMSPNERLYDQVADNPAALKTATAPGLLPTAEQQGKADARAELGGRRAGLLPPAPEGVTTPLVVAPAPAAPRASAQERLAAADAATQAERGQERLGEVSRVAQAQQAQTDAAAAAAATPAPRPAPAPDAVIAALKPIPALRTADQKATIDAARATMTPEQMAILEKAARGPFALDATERSQLQTMRSGIKASGKRTPADRLTSLAEKASGQAGRAISFTEVDPATLSERRRAGGGELSRQVYATIKQTARIFGKKVVIFDSSDERAADGFIFDDDANTIYINRKAEKPHLVVFGHELMHGLKRNSPEAYAAVARAVKLKQGVDLDKVAGVEGDMEELVSDLQGNRFAETDFWADVFRQVAGESPAGKQAVQKLAAAAMRAVNRVMKALGRPAGFEADQLVENLGEVKTAIQQALASYAKDRYADAVAMDRAERGQVPAAQGESGQANLAENNASAVADKDSVSAVTDRVQKTAESEQVDRDVSTNRRLPERVGPPTKAQMAARRARLESGQIASAKRVTETPEFKRWWGDDNTMVDASGAPRVLYHGTTKANERRITNFKRSAYGAMGPAVYLGDSPEASAGYNQGALMKVYARGKYLTNAQWTKYVNDHGWKDAEAAATADGWAGVHDTQFENAVAVWDPANIKSFDKNDGSFDEGEGIKSSEKRKPGQLDDVEAYHFSKGPRKELISAMYGTGLKGSGADEYRNAADERRRHRIYFYFDKGTGIRPEAGVGGAAHKAALNNVYDVNADPLKLKAGTQAKTETNILDAGFDGYLDRLEGTQSGQIIMLGQRAISVQALPPGTRVVSGKVVPGDDSQPVNPWKTYASGLSREDADATLARLQGKPGWRGYELEVAPSGNKYEIRMRAREEEVVRYSQKREDLKGLPATVKVDGKDVTFGAYEPAHQAAEDYARQAGVEYSPPTNYVKVDPARAKRIADAFEAMEHNPTDPEVAAAYDALIEETTAQYEAVLAAGLKVEFIDGADPYGNPRNAILDVVENNHMWVFPTDAGFGGSASADVDISGNPLLRPTKFKISGRTALANDLFRVVHDYFGHVKDGVGFRADGEENAWRSHAAMFTPLARRALTTETRGQNSWVNYGPFAQSNRTANGADTQYAPQKIGLLPEWVSEEGRTDDVVASGKRDQLDPEIVQALGKHIRNLTPPERAKLRRDTARKLVETIGSLPDAKEMAAVAYAGRAKRGWYLNSARAIEHVFGADGPRFAALLAALSPQCSVETNLYNTLSTWKNWVRAGRPTDREAIIDVMAESVQGGRGRASVLNAWINNSVRALASDDPSAVTLSGPKVNSFMLNLRGHVDEVTNDAWMANYALVDQTIFGGKLTKGGDPGKGTGYLAMSAQVRAAAKELSRRTGDDWTPAEVQETIWSWAKTIFEKAASADETRSARQLVLDQALTDDLIRSTPDFRTLFHDDINEDLLRQAGLGDRVDTLRRRSDLGGTGREGSPAGGQAAPFAGDVQRRYELRAADRLDKLREAGRVVQDDEVVESGKRDQTETPEFKKWFGDSKVVDAEGKPLVVYHGTNADFEIFDPSRTGMFGDIGVAGEAAYFTPYKETAVGYANSNMGGGQNVVPVYLKAENPLIWDYDAPSGRAILKKRQEMNPSEFRQWVQGQGYDSVKIIGNLDGVEDGVQWAVFGPTQIKSAIGNNGDFDQANPSITASAKRVFADSGRQYTPEQLAAFERTGRVVEELSLRERLNLLTQDWKKKLAQGIFDQFAPIKDLGAPGKAAYALARLSKGSMGAVEALLHHGKLKVTADGAYDADMSGGLVDRLFAPLGGESADFLSWVAANRAERLSTEDRENLFTPADIAALKALDSGKTRFDYTLQHGPNAGRTTRDRTLIYRDALKTFNEYQKNVLDVAEQSGLIDGSTRPYWEHEFYVPFYRQGDDGSFAGVSIKDGLVRQKAFERLKGGKDKLKSDLLENVLQNMAHLVDASAKNRAAVATIDAAQQLSIAYTVPSGTKGSVWIMRNGQAEHYAVEDPYTLAAISSLAYSGLKGFGWDMLTAPKRWLTIGVTASPAFKIRNLIRDSVSAIGVSELSPNILRNMREGWKASDKDSQTYVSALAGGGLIRFGTMLEGRQADRVRQLVKQARRDAHMLDSESKIRKLYDLYLEPAVAAYNELGNRSEEVNRSALYAQLIAKGVSPVQANLAARDLMDFSMMGAWGAVRFLSQVVPFLNARLQGLYKLGRGAAEFKKKFAYLLGAVALASITLMAAYSDDDWWKKREDWDRNTNWAFKIGDVVYRIPKPFEIGAIATLAERGLEFAFNPDMTGKRYAKNVRDLIMDNLSMNPVPQAIKPIVDLYANYDSFTDRQIENLSMQRLRPEYRMTASTSMLARGVSTAGNAAAGVVGGKFLSPVQVDHLIDGYFGWLGSFAMFVPEMVLREATGQPERPARDLYRFATQGIVQEVQSGSSYYVTSLYKQAEEIERAYATWRQLQKEGKLEEAGEFFEDYKDQIGKYKSVSRVKDGQAKLNEMIRMIERSTRLDADEKKERIRAIREQQDRLARTLTAAR